jgi:chemotaxis protein histidine kinase CheA
MDDILAEFIAETGENIAILERDLPAFQQNPSDRKLLDSIFRAMHTIKSSCGFANLAGLEAVAHDAESILMHMRDGDDVTPQNIDFVLNAVSLIKTIVQALEHDQQKEHAGTRPVSDAWKILPATIADLENRLGKKISLQTVGGDIQIHSHLVPVLKNAMVQIVRNAADHGIDQKGAITVNARSDEGTLILEVSDNGKGLSLPDIKKQILSRKLATEAELSRLLNSDIYDFIFRPGFSTVAQVNVFSGRGIGLDSVKDAITRAGGEVHVESAPAEGCRFIIKVPENPASALAVPASGATIP